MISGLFNEMERLQAHDDKEEEDEHDEPVSELLLERKAETVSLHSSVILHHIYNRENIGP